MTLLKVIGILAAIFVLRAAYEYYQKKIRKPKIGYYELFKRLLDRDDYVCIKGKVYRFSHITSDREIVDFIAPPLEENRVPEGCVAFYNPASIGYIVMEPAALMYCEFIYGKFGLKWAANKRHADGAEEKVIASIR